MTTESDILKSRNPVDKTRDLIGEISGDLTKKKAKRIFETPFTGVVNELDEDVRDTLFEAAIDEATPADHILWAGAFNSYAASLQLVEAIRKPGSFVEGSGSAYANEVLSGGNPISMVYALFRKNKDMSETEAKNLLELAHSTALIGLSNDARDAVFNYAVERGVSWFEVANQYDAVTDIVSRVKRPIYANL